MLTGPATLKQVKFKEDEKNWKLFITIFSTRNLGYNLKIKKFNYNDTI